jgi:hypothetical protein
MPYNQCVKICELNKLRIAIMSLCIRCNGTGRYLGNGMMMTDCALCDEDNVSEQPTITPKIDRKSKSYQSAIKDIMALNPTITRQEAVKMFDKAYHKD